MEERNGEGEEGRRSVGESVGASRILVFSIVVITTLIVSIMGGN